MIEIMKPAVRLRNFRFRT